MPNELSETRIRVSFLVELAADLPLHEIHAGIEEIVQGRIRRLKRVGCLSGDVLDLYYGRTGRAEELNRSHVSATRATRDRRVDEETPKRGFREVPTRQLRFVVTRENQAHVLNEFAPTLSRDLVIHIQANDRRFVGGWSRALHPVPAARLDIPTGLVPDAILSVLFDISLANCEPIRSFAADVLSRPGGERTFYAQKAAFVRDRYSAGTFFGPVAPDAGYASFAGIGQRRGAGQVESLRSDLEIAAVWCEFLTSVGVGSGVVVAAMRRIAKRGGQTNSKSVLRWLRELSDAEAFVLVRGAHRPEFPRTRQLFGDLGDAGAVGLVSSDAGQEHWGRWKCFVPARRYLQSANLLPAQLDGIIEATVLPRPTRAD
jgi:hypothetical protein